MHTDNFDILAQLIDRRLAQVKDEAARALLFFPIQILQRKKDIAGLPQNAHVIKLYQVKDSQDLLKKRAEITRLCELFEAHAMLNLNPKSYKEVAFGMLKKLSELLSQEAYPAVDKLLSSCINSAGVGSKELKKYWIIDVDEVSEPAPVIATIQEQLTRTNPIGEEKLVSIVPSKSGVHLITHPFDTNGVCFADTIEIKKDCLTNLLIC